MAKITDPDLLYDNIKITYSNSSIHIGNDEDRKEQIRNDVFIENRNRKIDSLLNDELYKEMKLKDHINYDNVFSPLTITQLYNYIQSIIRTDEEITPFLCETTQQIELNNSFYIYK